MGKIAFLFAGQGAQTSGMGQDLYTLGGSAAGVFDLAESLRSGTKQQCFAGTAEELAQTINTQPCVFTVELAAAYALQDKGIVPQAVAGFSLGEMAALTYANAFEPETGFSLVCTRAKLMQQANEEHPGAMAAVLRLEDAVVEDICKEFSYMYPVNYNSDGQLVVAGAKEEMDAFCAKVKEKKGTARPLAVGGGFHSPFMADAAKAFFPEIVAAGFKKPALPVYANYTSHPYSEMLEQTLAKQMENPVLWKQTIQNMVHDGYDIFIEVGPGKTLTGLVKRIHPEAQLFNVQDAAGVDAVVAAIS